MHIGGVMRTKLVTARPEESAAEAIRRMLESGIGSVIVIDEHQPVGMFTERDVLRLAGDGADFESIPVRRAMTARPLTIGAGDDILAASQMMAERKLRHLPVVEDGNLVGIVSMRDVLAYLAERLYSGDHDDAAHDTARSLLDRH
ncbi:MAG TPA: CBS domain-containing protein [Gaiellaceae bacterium]|nr:CBS domain-containing protein [Gaiellaceae bacterium]